MTESVVSFDPAVPGVLVLGDADSGKTTLIGQLRIRVAAGKGCFQLRTAPRSWAAVDDAVKRLGKGLRVRHTSTGTEVALTLPLTAPDGSDVDVVIPDYAGEDLQGVIRDRRFPQRWRDLALAPRWLFLIRLEKHARLPDLVSHPIDSGGGTAATDDNDVLPLDVWAVEVLQALLHVRRHVSATLPEVTLVLSCFDEIGGVGVTDGVGGSPPRASAAPGALAQERVALLDAFCRSRFGDLYRVVGLSAQGRELDEVQPDDGFVDDGAEQQGWIVRPDCVVSDDLTELLGTLE